MTSNQLKVIFNTDGSIEKFEFPKYVTQGSNNVVKLIVALAGGNIQDYQVIARFRPTEEPTDQTNTLVFDTNESSVTVYGDVYSNAKSVLLTSAQTYYSGILYVSIEVLGNGGEVLYSYPCKITVNPTTYNPDSTDSRINNAQYENLVRELGEVSSGYVEADLTNLTLADLYNQVGGAKISKFLLTNGTGQGYYIGVIAEWQGLYLFEFELYAGGSYGKDRWTGEEVAGSTLVSNILNRNSVYYAPYLVNGPTVDYDTATFLQLKDVVSGRDENGGIPQIVKLTGSSESAGFSNTGFYLVRISSSNDFIAIALDLQDRSLAGLVRYQGTISDTSTLIKDIFNPSSSYYKPYMLKDEVEVNPSVPVGTTPTDITGIRVGSSYYKPAIPSEITYLTTAPVADNTGSLKIVVLDEEPATKYDGYLYIITGSSNS